MNPPIYAFGTGRSTYGRCDASSRHLSSLEKILWEPAILPEILLGLFLASETHHTWRTALMEELLPMICCQESFRHLVNGNLQQGLQNNTYIWLEILLSAVAICCCFCHTAFFSMMAAFFPWSSYRFEATDDQNKEGIVSNCSNSTVGCRDVYSLYIIQHEIWRGHSKTYNS